MKQFSRCLGLSGIGLTLCAVSAYAQTRVFPHSGFPTQVVASFVMPQGTDPASLSFTVAGQLYTNADGVNAGDNSGPAITGQLLATNGTAPGGGLELHSRLPTSFPTVFDPVVDVDVFTTYTGGLEVDSLVGTPNTFNPWNVVRIAPILGYAQGFRFLHNDVNQADMQGNTGFYALFSAALADSGAESDFYASTFGIAGYSTIQATPEPGALVLLSGLMACGGLFWRKKSQRRSAR